MTPLRKRDALELIVIVPVATKPVWMAKRRCLVVRSSTQRLLGLQAHSDDAWPWPQEQFPQFAGQPEAIESKPRGSPCGGGSNEILSLPEDALAETALGSEPKVVSLLRLEHKPQTCFTMRLAGQPALP